MCGIAGIVAPNSHKYSAVIKRMTDSIRHRGPDGEGLKKLDGCYLGHRRLSIVDIEGGQQPMASFNNQSWITFNGEIYGYQDIRDKLNRYTFKSNCDTEVILALYHKYGEKFLSHLPGMFSFAIWDSKKQKLIAGRDRFGEKPFYYAWGRNGEFLFASEIKAILATELVDTSINEEALSHYLQYLQVGSNRSIYNEIHVLPPAHQLTVHEGKLEIYRYWDLPATNPDIMFEEAVDTFRSLFEKSVDKQLVADVRVGAFLSGGLDSTTVVYEASKENSQLSTYAFGFGEDINELPYADSAAQAYDTRHQVLDAGDYNLPELMYRMAVVYDEPFADSSCIPTYLISKEAAKHEKVILTGDGADELLGGYDFWYHYLARVENDFHTKWINNLPETFIHRIKYSAHRLGWKKLEKKIAHFLFRNQFSHLVQLQRYIRQYFSSAALERLGITYSTNSPLDKSIDDWDTLNTVLREDLTNYISADILVKTDRASMANSLELRAPFLDKDLTEFCISLPSKFKFDQEATKKLLRKSYQQHWPEVIKKRKKQGFGAPVKSWLELPGMNKMKERILNDSNHKMLSLIHI